MQDDRPTPATGPVLAVAAALLALLLAFAVRYGYHRDELYFVVLGGHPAWGYVDQPALVPLLAHATDAVSGHSLLVLRVPPALAAAAGVVLVGLTARELGARSSGQVLAAGSWAISAVVIATGHLASTTAFDLLGWTALTWLVARALRDGGRWWLLVGLSLGISLEVKTLVVFFAGAILLGLVLLGPRSVFRERWLWTGALLALVLWLPDLLWQATHGWPQLTLSSSIASGGSASSQPRALFLPYQVVQLSPVLLPVWVCGFWRLVRDRDLRRYRCFAVAIVVLAAFFLATGGKPYYLTGAFAPLLAAGAQPFVDWCRRGWLVVLLALGLVVNALLFVPVLPAAAIVGTPITAINTDAGETVGWPGFTASVRGAWTSIPSHRDAVVLTWNYGEAGALARFAPDLPAYCGHNALRSLGGPPPGTRTVLAIGYEAAQLHRWFGTVERVGTAPTPDGVDNDEAGGPFYLATAPKAAWGRIFPALSQTG